MSTIILDFDGTIADSFTHFLEIAMELTDNHGTVNAAEIERLRGMSLLHITQELHIRLWKMPFLVARGRQRMHAEMSEIKVFPDMPATIKKLTADGHQLYIMSSNSEQNIQVFLERYKMTKEFVSVHGSVGLFAKARVLKKIMRQDRLDIASTFYVGDEVRDIEAAQRAGVKMVSVTWGYNNEQAITAHQPDFIAHTPSELLKIFKS